MKLPADIVRQASRGVQSVSRALLSRGSAFAGMTVSVSVVAVLTLGVMGAGMIGGKGKERIA